MYKNILWLKVYLALDIFNINLDVPSMLTGQSGFTCGHISDWYLQIDAVYDNCNNLICKPDESEHEHGITPWNLELPGNDVHSMKNKFTSSSPGVEFWAQPVHW